MNRESEQDAGALPRFRTTVDGLASEVRPRGSRVAAKTPLEPLELDSGKRSSKACQEGRQGMRLSMARITAQAESSRTVIMSAFMPEMHRICLNMRGLRLWMTVSRILRLTSAGPGGNLFMLTHTCYPA